jgi:hypothetical protein
MSYAHPWRHGGTHGGDLSDPQQMMFRQIYSSDKNEQQASKQIGVELQIGTSLR